MIFCIKIPLLKNWNCQKHSRLIFVLRELNIEVLDVKFDQVVLDIINVHGVVNNEHIYYLSIFSFQPNIVVKS